MKKSIFLLVVLAITCAGISQPTFIKHYGGTNNQVGYAVKQCFDHGYVICGSARTTTGILGMYIVRLDSLGDTLWTRKWFGLESSVAFDVVQTHDSCFVMSGYINSSNAQVRLFKIGVNGDSMWSRRFGAGDWGQSLVETIDNGFMIVGSRMFKADSTGMMTWYSTYPPYQYMQIVRTPDSGFAMISSGSNNFCLTKTDSAGTIQWTRQYPGYLYNATNHVLITTSDGGYAYCGLNTSYTAYCLRTDSVGDTLWTANIYGYYGAGLAETQSGGLAVASSENSSTGEMYMTILDGLGNTLHVQHYGYYLDEWTQSLAPTYDGGFIMCGASTSYYQQAEDVFVVKTDSTAFAIGVGVNEYVQNNFMSIYPNPTNDRALVHLECRVFNGRMEIISATGQLVRSEQVNGNDVYIQRGNLEAGIYFVNISTDNGTVSSDRIIFTD